MTLVSLSGYLPRCGQFVKMFAFYVCYTSIKCLQKHACAHIHTKTKFLSCSRYPEETFPNLAENSVFPMMQPSLPGHLLPICGLCAIYSRWPPFLLTHLTHLTQPLLLQFFVPGIPFSLCLCAENATSSVKPPLLSQGISPCVIFSWCAVFPSLVALSSLCLHAFP